MENTDIIEYPGFAPNENTETDTNEEPENTAPGQQENTEEPNPINSVFPLPEGSKEPDGEKETDLIAPPSETPLEDPDVSSEPVESPELTENPDREENTDPSAEADTQEPEPVQTPVTTTLPVVEEVWHGIFPNFVPSGYEEIPVFQGWDDMVFYDTMDEGSEVQSFSVVPDALVYAPVGAFEDNVMFVPMPVMDEDKSLQELMDTMGEQEVDYTDFMPMDLSFFNEDGEEVEPATGPIYVKLTIPHPEFIVIGEELLTLYHMTEDGVEEVSVEAKNGKDELTIGFAASSFSTFIIRWSSSYQVKATYLDETGTDPIGNTKQISASLGSGCLSSLGQNDYTIIGMTLENGDKKIPIIDLMCSRTRSGRSYSYQWSYEDTEYNWQTFMPNSNTGMNLAVNVRKNAVIETPDLTDAEKQRAVMVFLNMSIMTLEPDGTYSGKQSNDWSNAIAPSMNIQGKDGSYRAHYFTFLDEYDTKTENGYSVPLVHNDISSPNSSNAAYFIAGSINNDDTSAQSNIDSRKLGKAGGLTVTTDSGTTTYRMQDFPTDDMVFSWLYENSHLTKNRVKDPSDPTGKTYLPASEVTADKYTIRWISMKYNVTDYWHLDGVLVKKNGQLVVKKTFEGDTDAIAAITDPAKKGTSEEFYISVAEEKENKADETDLYRLYLDRVEMRQDDGSYKEIPALAPTVSADGYTHTWPLSTKYERYHIMEHNYIYYPPEGGNRYFSTTDYKFSNLDEEDKGTLSEEWTTFLKDPDLSLTGRTYDPELESDAWQTIHFRNRYLPSSALYMNTVDSTNNTRLPDVEFAVTATKNGVTAPQKLWLVDGVYYFYEPDLTFAQSIEECSTMKVSSNGDLVIGGVGQQATLDTIYRFREIARPEGYTEASFQFRVDASGNLVYSEEDKSNSQAAGELTHEFEFGDIYTIDLNHMVDQVPIEVQKLWAEGTTSQSVTLELLKNGEPTGKTIVLSEGNWSGIFGDDFPVYGPSGKITYTVREALTSTGASTDGLYIVTVARKDTVEDRITTGIHLTVTNHRGDSYGSFYFDKVSGETGELLPGAEFQLYQDEACSVLLDTMYSDRNGRVQSQELPYGVYYMMEVTSPSGYDPNSTVYMVKVDNNYFSIDTVTAEGKESVHTNAETGAYEILNQKTVEVDKPMLPLTGGLGVDHFKIMGLSLTTVSITSWIVLKKKEEDWT